MFLFNPLRVQLSPQGHDLKVKQYLRLILLTYRYKRLWYHGNGQLLLTPIQLYNLVEQVRT